MSDKITDGTPCPYCDDTISEDFCIVLALGDQRVGAENITLAERLDRIGAWFENLQNVLPNNSVGRAIGVDSLRSILSGDKTEVTIEAYSDLERELSEKLERSNARLKLVSEELGDMDFCPPGHTGSCAYGCVQCWADYLRLDRDKPNRRDAKIKRLEAENADLKRRLEDPDESTTDKSKD